MAREPEAVCFTAGPKGAPFGAGVIHAWLVTDRQAPTVAAGISMGALTAAAMQRCYRELGQAAAKSPAEIEVARWSWFRRYLAALTHDPFGVLWRAVPSPVDFASDQPPVADMSRPESLADDEARARRHYYLLTQLGIWLAKLPVRFSSIATLVVHFVRWRERYGGWLRNLYYMSTAAGRIAAGFLWNLIFSPAWIRETHFGSAGRHKFRIHPLFGWGTWLAAVLIGLLLVYIPLTLVVFGIERLGLTGPLKFTAMRSAPLIIASAAAVVVALLGFIFFLLPIGGTGYAFRTLSQLLLSQLDLSQYVLDPYHLQRQLCDLFGDEPIEREPMDVLLVAADMRNVRQGYFEPGEPLLLGLKAALAVPGIFPPVKLDGRELIDGAAIRQNPLPALFDWLRNHSCEAKKLERASGPSIFVVYNVPIEPYDPRPDEKDRPVDIVDAAFASIELARRRDTRQEVRQTNFIADLVRQLPPRDDKTSPDVGRYLKISAAEIAPPDEIRFPNPWDPKPEEVVTAIASGCRASMERIHAAEIAATGLKEVGCGEIVRAAAPRRNGYPTADAPGLPEICAACPRTLRRRTEAPPPPATFGIAGVENRLPKADEFNRSGFGPLAEAPRIVFVTSGGVFRGAFHVGTLAALRSAGLKPDLIIGASVGALMGAALASIQAAPDAKTANARLHELARLFLEVDRRVALTRSFKNAVKQFGVRARRIDLSPAEVRRMVKAGSRADAGYAAAGAPPALIDAISGLFLIPHENTRLIAQRFVAGHFAQAVDEFLAQVRLETLPSLDIEYAVMGTSLLEGAARNLLQLEVTDVPQPYHKQGISFFATTSYLNRRMPLLLGRDFLTSGSSYDFIKACLSSSAFPSVFAPRTEAEVIPGRGRTTAYFSDGGMFDNLPFIPAIDVLRVIQQSGNSAGLATGRDPAAAEVDAILDRLKHRVVQRDVFIAAGLNADPGLLEKNEALDTVVKIAQRSRALESNGKIDAFVGNAVRTHKLLEAVVANARAVRERLLDSTRPPSERVEALKFLDGVVDLSVLKVVPADKKHINGTFAFCRALGMKQDTIRRSIGDGCFQTLLQVSKSRADDSFAALSKGPPIFYHPGRVQDGECPWFKAGGDRLKCPFADGATADVSAIRKLCASDAAHKV